MQPEKPSLYERLGGVYSIATVVDEFINRIMVDPRLNSNPLVDAAHHRVPLPDSNILSPRWSAGPPAARKNTPASPWLNRTRT